MNNEDMILLIYSRDKVEQADKCSQLTSASKQMVADSWDTGVHCVMLEHYCYPTSILHNYTSSTTGVMQSSGEKHFRLQCS